MRLAILSDTHGLLRPEVTEHLKTADAILHGGDINRQSIVDELRQYAPLYIVRGNNDKDWAEAIPHDLTVTLGGVTFFMVHNRKEVPADLETLFDAPDGLCPDAKIEVEAPDLETVKRVGLEHYRETLGKKMEGLRFLLERCNDGRRKSLFCTAVNLLELEDVEAVIARLEEEFGPEYPPEEQKDRGSRAAELFRERAQTRGVSLKLERQRKP